MISRILGLESAASNDWLYMLDGISNMSFGTTAFQAEPSWSVLVPTGELGQLTGIAAKDGGGPARVGVSYDFSRRR